MYILKNNGMFLIKSSFHNLLNKLDENNSYSVIRSPTGLAFTIFEGQTHRWMIICLRFSFMVN